MLDRFLPRHWLATAANSAIRLREADYRNFSVESQGRWVNRQPGMVLVSPDMHTAHHHQIRANVLDYWCQNYTPAAGDIVVDVGAGIGEEALVFSKLVGDSGKVICIEAHPGTFACLKETVRRSELNNVLPIHCAVMEREGQVVISDTSAHLGNSIVAADQGIAVAGRTLDSLLKELGVARVDLLKMNIEGAERGAMEGMTDIAPSVRHAAIACHDFIAEQGLGESFRTLSSVEAALTTLGFSVNRREGSRHPWLRDTLYADRPGAETAADGPASA